MTTDTYSYVEAVQKLNDGALMRRQHWDAGTFIYLVPGSTFQVNRPPLDRIFPCGTEINYKEHIDIHFATDDGHVCRVYHSPQEDRLATNWVEYDKEAERITYLGITFTPEPGDFAVAMDRNLRLYVYKKHSTSGEDFNSSCYSHSAGHWGGDFDVGRDCRFLGHVNLELVPYLHWTNSMATLKLLRTEGGINLGDVDLKPGDWLLTRSGQVEIVLNTRHPNHTVMTSGRLYRHGDSQHHVEGEQIALRILPKPWEGTWVCETTGHKYVFCNMANVEDQSNDLPPMVVYATRGYESRVWTRPLPEFLEKFTRVQE